MVALAQLGVQETGTTATPGNPGDLLIVTGLNETLRMFLSVESVSAISLQVHPESQYSQKISITMWLPVGWSEVIQIGVERKIVIILYSLITHK